MPKGPGSILWFCDPVSLILKISCMTATFTKWTGKNIYLHFILLLSEVLLAKKKILLIIGLEFYFWEGGIALHC